MLETTVRLLVALEASVVTVVAVILEAMEETVALAAVRTEKFPPASISDYFSMTLTH